MHPATMNLLQAFAYEGLPESLQDIARPFSEAAYALACGDNHPQAGTATTGHGALSGPDLSAALRHLSEARDSALRATLPDDTHVAVYREATSLGTMAREIEYRRARFDALFHGDTHMVAIPLRALAQTVADGPCNPDTADALRSLRRAMDAAIRAAS